ncbi:hypothetical protein vseg_011373 [Gypsophila vaccaria]
MSTFGVAITNETLKRMPKYKGHKRITQEDRAREAMHLIGFQNKNITALNYLLDLNQEYLQNQKISTLCMIYNATGSRLNLLPWPQIVDSRGREHQGKTPDSFENGQWIAFLHGEYFMKEGSEGARVFRGKSADGEDCDFMVAWHIPKYGSSDPNSAYTKVGPKDGTVFDRNVLLSAGKLTIDDSDDYCKSTVSIGGDTSSEFIAILEYKSSPLA